MVKKLLSGYHILLFLILTTFNGYGQCPTSVSVSTDPGTDICAGTSVTFTANPTGGGSYLYQWMINGSAITGETNKTFITNSLQNAQVVSVKVTSTA
ncbi:MAG TPA: hypothetical protein VFM60_01630, partial [Salinimicrobium sp.]|nr:hypothetical protein [Salinimicrobium sp.]